MLCLLSSLVTVDKKKYLGKFFVNTLCIAYGYN